MFYNTTNETGVQLERRVYRAGSQAALILVFFINHPHGMFTPSDIWFAAFDTNKVPLTSVRRSITDLTKDGYLIKTEKKKPGIYEDPEHFWKAKSLTAKQSKLF